MARGIFRELQSARAIAEKLGVERHVELPLDLRQFGGSALTADIDVPKDGVAETIPVTYVPARNLVFPCADHRLRGNVCLAGTSSSA